MPSFREGGARGIAVWLCALAFASSGCTKQAPPPTPQEAHLKALAVCFGRYLSQHQGKTPKDEAEFKAFVQKMNPAQIPGSPTNIDALFVSPRDNQPYVVRYGLDRAQLVPGPNMPVIAYEQTGVEGKRYIADMVGGVREVEEAKFKELVPNAGAGGS